MVFFTKPYLYAENIAAIEVGRLDSKDDAVDIHNDINNAIQKLEYTRLQSKVADANIVVVGRVAGVHQAKETEEVKLDSAGSWIKIDKIKSIIKSSSMDADTNFASTFRREIWFQL
jgi:hypothetical protein